MDKIRIGDYLPYMDDEERAWYISWLLGGCYEDIPEESIAIWEARRILARARIEARVRNSINISTRNNNEQ